jgi:hypothetical protein
MIAGVQLESKPRFTRGQPWAGFEAVGEAPDGLTAAMHSTLDSWIEVWRKVGGLQQFLPPRKAREVQAGK